MLFFQTLALFMTRTNVPRLLLLETLLKTRSGNSGRQSHEATPAVRLPGLRGCFEVEVGISIFLFFLFLLSVPQEGRSTGGGANSTILWGCGCSDTVSIRKLNLSGNNRDVDNWRKFCTLEKVSWKFSCTRSKSRWIRDLEIHFKTFHFLSTKGHARRS